MKHSTGQKHGRPHVSDWQRRILWATGIVVATLLSYAFVYQWGMRVYEDQSVLFIQALQVVIESITTAGFGGHAPWSSPQMNAMILFMNLTGVLFVFLAVPLFVVPVLRDAFEQRPPETFVFRDDDQVVIVGTDEGVNRFEERFLQ